SAADDPITEPPPPGEDDAYSAATKVGAMPDEILEKLRAEGLLPPEDTPPKPPRPAPPRPSSSLRPRREELASAASASEQPPAATTAETPGEPPRDVSDDDAP